MVFVVDSTLRFFVGAFASDLIPLHIQVLNELAITDFKGGEI